MCVYFCFRVCFFAFFEGLCVEGLCVEGLCVEDLRVDALRVDALRVDEVLMCFFEGQNFSWASFIL